MARDLRRFAPGSDLEPGVAALEAKLEDVTDAQLAAVGAKVTATAARDPDSPEADLMVSFKATGRAIPRDEDIALYVNRHAPTLFTSLLE